MERRRARRAILPWAFAFSLGLITTLTVAAACAWRVQWPSEERRRWGERLIGPGGVNVPHPADGHAPPNTMYFEFHTSDHVGVTFAYSRLRTFTDYTSSGAPPPVNPRPEAVAAHWERSRIVPWITGDRPWPTDNTQQQTVTAKAAGWPWPCFWCEMKGHDVPAPGGGYTHDYIVTGGLAYDNAPKSGWADWPPDYPRIIPVRPIWPELVGNTLVFSAAWALPFVAFAALRRAGRRRRGRCERCGYDRRGLTAGAVCPECGAALRGEG